MVVPADAGRTTSFACKCLNVRINPAAVPPPLSPTAPDPDYSPVYVADDGILVVHTQLTLRIRSRAKQQQHTSPDSAELTRYTTLKCLVCSTLVYRVFQVISPDVDAAEGPVAPSEDWTERELLKSLSGWIEVHTDCITGDAIAQTEASPLNSRLFGIVLPPEPPLASVTAPQYPSHSTSPTNPITPSHHLPALQPLFLPPPFTPAHPVFRHISAIADAESVKLRDEAEAFLRKVVQEKVAELEAAEYKLKQEVELLWISYKQSVSEAAPTVNGHRTNTGSGKGHQSTSSRSGLVSPGPGPVNGTSASVRIHEFIPAPSVPRRASAVASPPHHSALSSSIATSSFHHPRALTESEARPAVNGSTSPPAYSSNPPSPSRTSASGAPSLVTASSRTLDTTSDPIALSIRDASRRNMDESIDMATSLRYQSVLAVELAAQLERGRPQDPRREPEEEPSEPSESSEAPIASGSVIPARGRSPRTGKSAIKKPKTNGNTPSPSTKRSTSGEGDKTKETPTKGKRKVTFDVKPDVAIISPNGPVHILDDSKPEQEAVFDMENERDDLDVEYDATSPPPSLPMSPASEPVRAPVRHQRSRSANMHGLPSSFSALRPESLPIPTSTRPPIPHEPIVDDRPRSEIVRESLLFAESKGRSVDEYVATMDAAEDDEKTPTDPREAEILRLVAASTPSHRSAWKKDSKAWQVFVARHGRGAKTVHNSIAEEEEDSAAESNNGRSGYYDESEDDTSGLEDDLNNRFSSQVAQSLPIAIDSGRFGLASYQPKTSLSDRPGILVPPLRATSKVSSEALKRASYAERDRMRSIDPGALDFTADDDDEEDDELEDEAEREAVGGKGRQRALKILEARSELPAEGMWRSLAT